MSVVRDGTSSLSRGAKPALLLQCLSGTEAATPEGKSWPQWPRMTSSASTQTHILDVRLVHSNIFPITTRWSVWRGWVCGRIAAGSPWLGATEGYLGEGPVMVVCQRPWTRPMIQCNEHLWLDKWYNVWHTAVSNATRTEKAVLERKKKYGRAKCLLFVGLF